MNNKVYTLYSPDYECPRIIGYFENEFLAYDYAKKYLKASNVFPLDDKKEQRYSSDFEYDYFIKENIVYKSEPKTFLSINIYYDGMQDIETSINNNILVDYINEIMDISVKEQYNETDTSIFVVVEITPDTVIEDIIEKYKEVLRKKLKEKKALVLTNKLNMTFNDFYNNVEIIYPSSNDKSDKQDIKYKYQGENLEYVLMGLFKIENKNIQLVKREDLVSEMN